MREKARNPTPLSETLVHVVVGKRQSAKESERERKGKRANEKESERERKRAKESERERKRAKETK